MSSYNGMLFVLHHWCNINKVEQGKINEIEKGGKEGLPFGILSDIGLLNQARKKKKEEERKN